MMKTKKTKESCPVCLGDVGKNKSYNPRPSDDPLADAECAAMLVFTLHQKQPDNMGRVVHALHVLRGTCVNAEVLEVYRDAHAVLTAPRDEVESFRMHWAPLVAFLLGWPESRAREALCRLLDEAARMVAAREEVGLDD